MDTPIKRGLFTDNDINTCRYKSTQLVMIASLKVTIIQWLVKVQYKNKLKEDTKTYDKD